MNKTIPTLIIAAASAMPTLAAVDKNFNYHVDRFADIEVLRYEVPEFDRLTLNQKKMVYYLTQAAQMGRDIIWDQNGRTTSRSASFSRMSTPIIKVTVKAPTSRLSRNT